MRLSRSQEDYLKTVYELSSGHDESVRVCDVAEQLSVSKASASLALKKLAEQGFIYKDADRHAHLTEIGERQAIQLLDKFEVIRTFLVKVLYVDKATADHDACAIEHVISADTLCAICRFSKRTGCTNACSLSHKPDA